MLWPPSEDPVSRVKSLTVRETSHETAQQMIEEHHYLHTMGATSVALGLFDGVDRIAGVMTFGTIIEKNAAAICGPKWADGVFELTRLVVHDWAGKNSESFFIGQAFRWLRANRPDRAVLISYADSAVGHIGTIYQATNWLYTGYSTKGGYVSVDGTKFHARSVSDSRKGVNAASHDQELRWEPMLPKHRYLYFLKPEARHDLRWPVLPYPAVAASSDAADSHSAEGGSQPTLPLHSQGEAA